MTSNPHNVHRSFLQGFLSKNPAILHFCVSVKDPRKWNPKTTRIDKSWPLYPFALGSDSHTLSILFHTCLHLLRHTIRPHFEGLVDKYWHTTCGLWVSLDMIVETVLVSFSFPDFCANRDGPGWLEPWGIAQLPTIWFIFWYENIRFRWTILSQGTVEDVAEVSIDLCISFVGETHCPRQEDGENIDQNRYENLGNRSTESGWCWTLR